MSFIVTTSGDSLVLAMALNKTSAGNTILHLYKNNWVPTKADVPSSYEESNEAGYSARTLAPTDWTITSGVAASTAQIFSFLGPATISGYYLTNATESTVILAEQFETAYTIPEGGGSLAVTIQWTAN